MRKPLLSAIFCSVLTLVPPAHAVVPVVDHSAIVQLIRQISYWQQQLQAMTYQLDQLRSTYASMTGQRGMQSVLPTTMQQRNYLPPDYAELMNIVSGSSTSYAGLANQVQVAIRANAILTTSQLETMTPEMRQTIENGRRAAAMTTALSRAAYQNTSLRFEALQQLITMIGNTQDLKAIEELQARVNAEQAMLTNEQTKLQMLAQVESADESAQRQRLREQVMAGHGGFSSRFTPNPDVR